MEVIAVILQHCYFICRTVIHGNKPSDLEHCYFIGWPVIHENNPNDF